MALQQRCTRVVTNFATPNLRISTRGIFCASSSRHSFATTVASSARYSSLRTHACSPDERMQFIRRFETRIPTQHTTMQHTKRFMHDKPVTADANKHHDSTESVEDDAVAAVEHNCKRTQEELRNIEIETADSIVQTLAWLSFAYLFYKYGDDLGYPSWLLILALFIAGCYSLGAILGLRILRRLTTKMAKSAL